jgi:GT2 family glycosyltransferase
MFSSEYKIIKKSGLFDKKYYLKTYDDVKKLNIDPLKHFIENGWKEGRNPSDKFYTNFYLETNKDVKDAKINPLIHYIKYGKKEKRKTVDNVSMDKVDSKIIKIFKILKYAKNNPQLVKRSIEEIKLFGFKKTILKIKNKYNKIEKTSISKVKIRNFNELIDLFDEKIIIPNFKTSKPIDIIIPVYNGFEFLEPLINSIIKNTSMSYRIFMCDDRSSDERVLPLLKKLKDSNPSVNITLLENEQNLGFIKTVNKLVKYTNNHFVLLNTDTELPPHWIERLMYPIFEMKNIASTTPFTNAGTICSFPNYLEDNPIFEDMDVEKLDNYFQYVNFEKTFIEIPTGVGFCMGVNKTLVTKIGMFDEIFGKGYGEENDWCQRAIKNGYKNIHVTNLFVYHKHGGSFPSEEKQRLISKNLTVLNQKHPTYDKKVQELVERNELENLRTIMQIRIKNINLSTLLIFDHGLGGGANEYIHERIEERKLSKLTILIRYDFNVYNVYNIQFIVDNMNFKYYSPELSDIFKLLSKFRINEIFVNSLVSYPNVKETINEIIYLKNVTKSKIILPIHDFFPICPSFTLLNRKMNYCGVPSDFKVCMDCLNNDYNKSEFKIFEKETNIKSWRESWIKIIEITDEILCFSASSKEIFLKAYPNSEEKINVLPHDISGRYKNIYNPNKKTNKRIIGVLGGINEPKGANIIKDLVEYIDKNKLNAKVILIGQISIPLKSNSFEVTGRYDKKDLPEIVTKLNITEFLIPSICPETFSYTTDEIMQMGYPLIVFDLGAPAERVKHYKLGKVIAKEDLYSEIF